MSNGDAADTTWGDRHTRTAMVAPEELISHPNNWRLHPDAQREATTASLDRLGWVRRIVVNERTGHILDGHLRVHEAAARQADTGVPHLVPVQYVDLTEAEERVALIALDSIAGMAIPDAEVLAGLVGMAADDFPDDEAIGRLLAVMAAYEGVTGPVTFQPLPDVTGDQAEVVHRFIKVEVGNHDAYDDATDTIRAFCDSHPEWDARIV